MKKSIIISIKPEWVEKILNREKTIEIRKSMPKCDLPVDVYIYCVKAKPFLMVGRNDNKTYLDNGGKDSVYSPNHNYIGNGKIVAKFTLNKVERFDGFDIYMLEDLRHMFYGTCLNTKQIKEYSNGKDLLGWHIDNLEIFDEPIELNEFYRNNYQVIQDYEPCNNYNCIYAVDNSILGDDGYCPVDECPKLRIRRAFQSWGYAYKEG